MPFSCIRLIKGLLKPINKLSLSKFSFNEKDLLNQENKMSYIF